MPETLKVEYHRHIVNFLFLEMSWDDPDTDTKLQDYGHRQKS